MNDEPSSLNASADPRGEFPFAPPDYVFMLLAAIARYRDAELEKLLRPLDLTVARHRALQVIERFEPCGMSELADFSVVDRTTMTRTVDQLVAGGWVERAIPADRRQVLLTLTPAGRDKLAAAVALVWRRNRDDLEGIEDDAQRALVRLSQDLVANLAPDPEARELLLTFRRPRAKAEGT